MLIGFTSLRNVFRALDALLLMILDVFFFIPKTRVALVITGGISWLDYPCSGTKSAFAPEIFFSPQQKRVGPDLNSSLSGSELNGRHALPF